MAQDATAKSHAVPRTLVILFVAAIALQLALAPWRPKPAPVAQPLPAPPPLVVLRAAALGEPRLVSAAIVLWLQAFDDQPGVALGFRDLDYDRLSQWLGRALALDPGSDYPLLLA